MSRFRPSSCFMQNCFMEYEYCHKERRERKMDESVSEVENKRDGDVNSPHRCNLLVHVRLRVSDSLVLGAVSVYKYLCWAETATVK